VDKTEGEAREDSWIPACLPRLDVSDEAGAGMTEKTEAWTGEIGKKRIGKVKRIEAENTAKRCG